eukprot:4043334-Ditylum_brightwellii.AAC.2
MIYHCALPPKVNPVVSAKGNNLNFEHGFVQWLENKAAMKPTVNGMHSMTIEEYSFLSLDDGVEDEGGAFISEIKEAK